MFATMSLWDIPIRFTVPSHVVFSEDTLRRSRAKQDGGAIFFPSIKVSFADGMILNSASQRVSR